MNTATRVGAFVAALALAFGTAFGIGNAVGPTGSDPDPGPAPNVHEEMDMGNDDAGHGH